MVAWYAASLVIYLKFDKGPQDCFLTWEDVCLVNASSRHNAMVKARRFGRERQNDPGSTVWNNRPGQWVFAGVRQLIDLPESGKCVPGDGIEVSFAKFFVRRTEDFHKLIQGETVTVWCAGIIESIERAFSKNPRRIPYVEF